ncbi:hypothetical protein LTR42_006206 [Elasticomyces elasticus]|nr:hypothetical protein LTR42_006206 [Elasticomyces elasticus]
MYCSRECQEAEFHAHKLLCKTFNGMKVTPADGMVRVLYFPVEGKPEFKFLHTKQTNTSVELDYKSVTGAPLTTLSVVDRKAITDAPIESPFHVRYSDKPAAVNQSIVEATDTSEAVPLMDLRHIDMQAYAHVVAWLTCSGERIEATLKGPKVYAVKMLCNGSLPAGEKARCRDVKLPRLHASVRGRGYVSSLSKEISMPLRFAKSQTPKNVERRNPLIFNMLQNPVKYRGGIDMDLIMSPWMHPGLGNVYILRDDLEAVSAGVVEAFAAFGLHAWVTVTCYKDRPMGTGHTMFDREAAPRVSSQGWAEFMAKWSHDKVVVLNEVNNEALGNEYDLLESISGVAYEGVPWKENERKTGDVKTVAYAITTENA